MIFLLYDNQEYVWLTFLCSEQLGHLCLKDVLENKCFIQPSHCLLLICSKQNDMQN